MNALRIAAIALIVAGVLALAYGRFTWTEDRQAAKLGPIELTVKERREVNLPAWAGVAGIAAGIGLLIFGLRKP